MARKTVINRSIKTVALIMIGLTYTYTKILGIPNSPSPPIAKQAYITTQTQINEYARYHFIPLTQTIEGKSYHIHRISQGIPIYKTSHNKGSVIKLSADTVITNGSLNTNLSGNGIKVGIWDEGTVLSSHQEFDNESNRIVAKDSADAHDHATHVAGTIGAHGENVNAMGFASKSQLYTYDWDNVIAEMVSGFAEGVLVANHSWGFRNGWTQLSSTAWDWSGDVSISTAEDYKFGLYGEDAVNWDAALYTLQKLTIIKSVGNDRSDVKTTGAHFHNGNLSTLFNDSHNDDGYDNGGYDTIDSISCAKNILTVGAITSSTDRQFQNSSDAIMTTYSAWGPCDDGRIKPDLVAKGNNVFSSTSQSDSSYAQQDGTSFSAPAITGTVALLLEYYKSLFNDETPNASTVKAILLHTANDVGNTGPDYQYGWGLANAQRAIQLIGLNTTNNLIFEETLSNNTLNSKLITKSAGNQVKITLVWTDPSGQEQTTLDSRTPNLVNDLDIRLINTDDTSDVIYPWTLDPTQPQSPATLGDNSRDNSEQIIDTSEEEKSYRLEISHKGTLSRSQNYSLIIDTIGSIQTQASSEDDNAVTISNFLLGPNPLRSISQALTINYSLSSEADVSLFLFQLDGTILKTEHFSSNSQGGLMGQNAVSWDISGLNLPNGVYITYVVAKNGSFVTSKKSKLAILQ